MPKANAPITHRMQVPARSPSSLRIFAILLVIASGAFTIRLSYRRVAEKGVATNDEVELRKLGRLPEIRDFKRLADARLLFNVKGRDSINPFMNDGIIARTDSASYDSAGVFVCSSDRVPALAFLSASSNMRSRLSTIPS